MRLGKNIDLNARDAVLLACLVLPVASSAQSAGAAADVHVAVQVSSSSARAHAPAAVVWLDPVDTASPVQPASPGRFTLLQKNRMFTPHLLVIPAGSTVSFPNADPFFHNVFSLFNGKRFDLGLYEAGTSKEVVFSRPGVSYVFCNIHPEMSAVVLALTTPLYGIADPSEKAVLHGVPAGQYTLHIWVEGLAQPALDRMTRRIVVRGGGPIQISIDATDAPRQPAQHLNKFGQPYDHHQGSPY